MIKLDNLLIGENFNITQEIIENEIVFYYSRDNNLLINLFLYISGINKSKNVLYNDRLCYENEEYFKQRIYLSFENKLIKTIYPQYIASTLLHEYRINCNPDELSKMIEILSIRQECEMNQSDPFTPAGNTLINFALLQSLEKQIIIINNPTINITNEKQIEFISSTLSAPSNQIKLIGLNNISHFKNKINKIIIFNDYGRTLKFEPYKTQIGLASGDARGILQIIKDYQKLFFTYKNDRFQLLFVNTLDKEQYRELSRNNCKIEKVNFYDLEKYL